MKKILFVFLMLLCSVSYAEWEDVGKTDSYANFVDRSTIRTKGNFVEMWILQNFFDEQVSTDRKKWKSTTALTRFDCKDETLATVFFINYAKENGKGDAVFSYLYKTNEIRDLPIAPGTTSELLWQIACGRE